MKLLLLCDAGAETACAQENENLKLLDSGPGYLIVEADKKNAALTLYQTQVALDVLLFLGEGEPEAIPAAVDWKDPELAAILAGQESFALRSYRLKDGESMEIEGSVGGMIQEQIGKKVDLENPHLLFLLFQSEGKTLLGLSLAGRELRKREYRIFTSNRSLRATVAAAILRLSGYVGEGPILMPTEDDGTLAIEAAMMAMRRSPSRYRRDLALIKYWEEAKGWYDTADEQEREPEHKIGVIVPSVQFLKAVQKNAKIAGVQKQIEVTKAEIDWIDTKFEERSMRVVVGQLPCSGKHRSEKQAVNTADDLAYQCKYVLADDGTIGLFTLKPDELALPFLKHGFVEHERYELWMGEQCHFLLLFKRK